MKWVSFLSRIFLALFIGFVITLYFLQFDKRFQQKIEAIIERKYSEKLQCIVQGSLKKINFFSPRLEIENLSLSAQDISWQWHCDKMTVSFSWLGFLLEGKLPLVVRFYGLKAESLIDKGHVSIASHINQLVNQQDDEFILKNLKTQHLRLLLKDVDHDIASTVLFHAECGVIDRCFNGRFTIINGDVEHKNITTMQDMSLSIALKFYKHQSPKLTASIDGSVLVPLLDEESQVCFVRGSWDGTNGSIMMHNKNAFSLYHNVMQPDNKMQMHTDVHLPLALLQKILGFAVDFPLKGSSSLCFKYNLFDDEYKGKFCIDRCGYDTTILPTIDGSFIGSSNDVSLSFVTPRSSWLPLFGSWQWNGLEHQFDIKNSSAVGLFFSPYWHLNAHDSSLHGIVSSSGDVRVSCHAKASNEKTGAVALCDNVLTIQDAVFSLTGMINDTHFDCNGILSPDISFKKITCTHKKGGTLFDFDMNDKNNEFIAAIKNEFLRSVSSSLFKYDLSGKGDIHIAGNLDKQRVFAQCSLQDANIRLGQTYNFINTLQNNVRVDLKDKKCTVSDVKIKLQEGGLRCSRATWYWADRGRLMFAHVPIIFQKVLLNVDKDFFATFSGNVLFHRSVGQAPKFKGKVIIDRAQLKRNLFSSSVRESLLKDVGTSLLGSDAHVDFDIDVISRNPLHVKTSFLQTDVHVDMNMQGSSDNPQVSGVLSLHNGKLMFPYRPLHVVSGKMFFMPHQITDPTIELLAKGRIKKYTITMRVSGSAKHPYIQFSSSPLLTEQQIITLLLSGSEEGSLLTAMPSLIMHNVKGLLFGAGTQQGPSKVERYVTNIWTSIKNIRKHINIVPSFTDQTARGGFRATLEINVNDQLRAWFRKNFSLTEDTRFEIEYQVSDDVGLRLMKDERSDVGGEVEMRWKF